MTSRVLRMETFKSGPFSFSINYNREKFLPYAIKAKELMVTIKDIPILPELVSQLSTEIIMKSIFSTAALEGNPLSQEEVSKILQSKDKEQSKKRVEKEIQNLKLVYNKLEEVQPLPSPYLLKEEEIKLLHKIITDGCMDEKDGAPGNYRNHEVKVGDEKHGGVYKPPKCLDDVRNLMKVYVDWLNSPDVLEEDLIIRPALAHFYLGMIHPFGDGNGRLSRVVEAFLLKSAGMKFVPPMLSNFYYKNIDDYYWAFTLSENNSEQDISPFLEFYFKGLIGSLEEVKSFITWKIRALVLRDYYIFLRKKRDLTEHQFDLLIALLEKSESFKLTDLFDKDRYRIIYRNVSERTARRDLEKLQKKALLVTKEGMYSLNFFIL